MIGDCGLQPLEHRGPEAELGYDFHPRVWGRGFATEAAREVMRLAVLGIETVVAVVKPEHVASQHVLQKAGLRRSGAREAYGESMVIYEDHRDQPSWAVRRARACRWTVRTRPGSDRLPRAAGGGG